MKTFRFPSIGSLPMPEGLHTRFRKTPHPLLWVSGALAIATIVFAVALIAGTLMPSDMIAIEIEPAVIDPFAQQNLEDAASLATETQAYLNNLWPRMTRSQFSK